MQDFETLYDEKLSSMQDNEIVDEYFMSLLRTHSFVELLKSLYYSPHDADMSIYLECLKQGYRMCDLQRAFCFLNDEWYDGPICIIVEERDSKEELVEVSDEPVETISRFTEEYFLRIRLISEEEVIIGETNSIKIESNLFSVNSIFSEAAEGASLNIDQNNVLSIRNSGEELHNNSELKLDASNVEVVHRYNSDSVQCLDGDLAGDFYYAIINAADELFSVLEKENCLMRTRQYIDSLNVPFAEVQIERFINDKSIVEKCNQSSIYNLADLSLIHI